MSELRNEIADLLTAAGAAPEDLPTVDEVAERVPSFYDGVPRQGTMRLLAERLSADPIFPLGSSEDTTTAVVLRKIAEDLRCTDLYHAPNEVTQDYRDTLACLDVVLSLSSSDQVTPEYKWTAQLLDRVVQVIDRLNRARDQINAD